MLVKRHKKVAIGIIALFVISSLASELFAKNVLPEDKDNVGTNLPSKFPSVSGITAIDKEKGTVSNFISESPSEHVVNIAKTLAMKLAQIPRKKWKDYKINVIVTYSKDNPVIKRVLASQYETQILSTLPVAYISTTLDRITYLRNLNGIKSIYLDEYYQWIDPNWKKTNFHVAGYPYQSYIGAKFLQQMGINGSGVKIAIIDTGIDKTHPDLDDMDNDPNTDDPKVIAEKSFVDYDFDGINDTDTRDEFGHGTHCAGIAAANGILKGVAPGAYLINAKALDYKGSGYLSWLINAINWAVESDADIISMSLGFMPGSIVQLINEIANSAREQGVMVVVAAGNSGPELSTIASPGLASRALTVGASNKFNITTSWSSRGPSINGIIDPDVVAPGDNILSTVPKNNYYMASGTSMSTPVVAGVAALLRSAYPNVDIDLIRAAILSTATDLNLSVFEQGAGLVNAKKAYYYLSKPTVYAFPSFSTAHPLRLSPHERFSYQFDVFVNQSYSHLSIEPSSNLAPHMNISFVDSPTSTRWIRAKVDVIMPSQPLEGKLFIKNGTTILYSVPLSLDLDPAIVFDGGIHTDAGETLFGAISLSLGVTYYGTLHLNDYQDLYSFPVIEEHSYRITMLSNVTLRLMILDENGSFIDFYEGKESTVNFTAFSTGNYYVRVFPSSKNAEYTITADEIPKPFTTKRIYLTGHITSYGKDSSGDNYYDYLVFEVEVNVTVKGTFVFNYVVCQKRDDYALERYRVEENKIEVELKAGTHKIYLMVDGRVLEQSKYTGPYILASLTILEKFATSLYLVEYEKDLYVSPSYSYSLFEPAKSRLDSLNYYTINVDGSGNPEIFEVDCALTLNYEGYHVVQLLISPDVNMHTTITVTLPTIDVPSTPYKTTAKFDLSGYEWIKYEPLVIVGVVINSPRESQFVPIFDVLNISDFGTFEPLFTYTISERLVDYDQSDASEAIELVFNFNSKVDTQVNLISSYLIFSLTNETAISFINYNIKTVTLTKGSNEVSLPINTSIMAAKKLMGPFLIPSVVIECEEYGFTIATPYTTNYYDYRDFELPVVYVNYLGYNKITEGESCGLKLNFDIISRVQETATIYFFIIGQNAGYFRGSFEYSQKQTISPGTNKISILISCCELLKKRFEGTLSVFTIMISDSNNNTQYSEYDLAFIPYLSFREFSNCYEAYIEDFRVVEYINNDTDSLLEGINIRAKVKINDHGIYTCSLELEPPNPYGNPLILTNEIVANEPGLYEVDFFVSAAFIVRNMAMLNRISANLTLISNSTDWRDSYSKYLEIYQLSQFDYQLPVLYSYYISSELYDSNNDDLFDGIKLTLNFEVKQKGNYAIICYFLSYAVNNTEFLDIIKVKTPNIYLTTGNQEVTIRIISQKLSGTKVLLPYFKTKFFELKLAEVHIEDKLGLYNLIINDMIPEVYDITTFDFDPLVEIITVKPYLTDENGDNYADHFAIDIKFKLNSEIEALILKITLFVDYRSKEYGEVYLTYCYEFSLEPTLGMNTFETKIELSEIIDDPSVKKVNIQVRAELYTLDYDPMAYYDYYSEEFDLSKPITTSTTHPITTIPYTSTKKNVIALLTVMIAVLAGSFGLRKRKRQN